MLSWCLITLVATMGSAHATARVALVIGNAAYVNVPALSNPVDDAADVGAALSRLGFDVTVLTNATKGDMDKALKEFRLRALGSKLVYLKQPAAVSVPAGDDALWNEIKDVNAPALFEFFLNKHPTSNHAPEAREWLKALESRQSPQDQPSPHAKAGPAATQTLADYRRKLDEYQEASAAFEAEAGAYWSQVSSMRRARDTKTRLDQD
jgi:hypothetical protein